MNNNLTDKQIEEFVVQGTRFAGFIERSSAILTKIAKPLVQTVSGGYTVHLEGVLEVDFKSRGLSGRPIRTSWINEIYYKEDEDLTIVFTRNSTYFTKGNLLAAYGINSDAGVVDCDTLESLINGNVLHLNEASF